VDGSLRLPDNLSGVISPYFLPRNAVS
jgi:hypothetical protein